MVSSLSILTCSFSLLLSCHHASLSFPLYHSLQNLQNEYHLLSFSRSINAATRSINFNFYPVVYFPFLRLHLSESTSSIYYVAENLRCHIVSYIFIKIPQLNFTLKSSSLNSTGITETLHLPHFSLPPYFSTSYDIGFTSKISSLPRKITARINGYPEDQVWRILFLVL